MGMYSGAIPTAASQGFSAFLVSLVPFPSDVSPAPASRSLVEHQTGKLALRVGASILGAGQAGEEDPVQS